MRTSVFPVVLLLAGAAMFIVSAQEVPSIRTTMDGFSRAFRAMESAAEAGEEVDAGDLKRLVEVAEGIGLDSTALARLKEATTEGTVEEIRTACLQCHGRFRDSTRCEYPSTDGMVSGTVTISDVGGEEAGEHGDVVVFLEAPELVKAWPAPKRNPVISQKNRQFSPRVLPVVVGTTVKFPNDDSILHNVFSLSKAKRFDLEIFRPGDTGTVTFDSPGLVRVYCNIHPHMNSSILVLANPYFAVTDTQGRFVIPEVPPGSYKIRVWNSLGAASTQEVTVEKLINTRISIEATETKKSLKHKDKHGRPYRKKY